MHLLIASLVCYVLLFSKGYAEKKKDFQCEQNVPEIAKEALLSAINEKRNELEIPDLGNIEYNYKLAKKAVGGEFGRSTVGVLEGESDFEESWNATIKQALTSKRNDMIKVAKTVGCEITLTTLTQDGSHKVKLYCLLGNE